MVPQLYPIAEFLDVVSKTTNVDPRMSKLGISDYRYPQDPTNYHRWEVDNGVLLSPRANDPNPTLILNLKGKYDRFRGVIGLYQNHPNSLCGGNDAQMSFVISWDGANPGKRTFDQDGTKAEVVEFSIQGATTIAFLAHARGEKGYWCADGLIGNAYLEAYP